MADNAQPILVTGGAGYIGSHVCLELLTAGHDVVVLDNLSNASERSVRSVQQLADREFEFVEGDVRDAVALKRVFDRHDIAGVLHLAGLKAVGESVSQPHRYYDNNVRGTLQLVEAMAASSCRTLVFSSSATVYGIPGQVPIVESAPTKPINPYGRSKLMVEQILQDLSTADPSWRISLLRYFNPVGAHPSGEIGEHPRGVPNNLMPFIAQVASGRLDKLRVFGDDYETDDGTGVRDYIHVMDLARGHVKALEYLAQTSGCFVHNLGTGRGYSVFEALRAFERASGKEIPHEVVARRPGDAAVSYADASKALDDFGWRAQFDLSQMCTDLWRWQQRHPNGYDA